MRYILLVAALLFSGFSFSQEMNRSRLHIELTGNYTTATLETEASQTTKPVKTTLNFIGLKPTLNYFILNDLAAIIDFSAGIEPTEKFSTTGFSLGIRKFFGNSTQRLHTKIPEIEIRSYKNRGFYGDLSVAQNTISSDSTNINFLGFSAALGHFWSLSEKYYLLSSLQYQKLNGDNTRDLNLIGLNLGVGTFFY